ncbi:hypothetical protein FB567DRAFT_532805 [Paraphoma chrysanthemicola]|uniref:Uncharacterized protein n=1 Tax=Paraphoma chrysanthemicola TaxID=798071 RepID=A0A8K0VVS6_9PLEO|nr:hypothetical protein FB567DRAFT_532805 [Paraphoma chrysanthemicola]
MLLSCQVVCRDLNSEFLAKLHPLFTAQRDWRRRGYDREPIRFMLYHNHTSRGTSSKLVIKVPFLGKWHRSARRHDFRWFGTLCAILQPTLLLPWHTLTMRFVHPDSSTPLFSDLTFLSFKFFESLEILSTTTFVLKNVRRFVLHFPDRGEEDSKRIATLQELFMFARLNMTGRLSESEKVKRGWACQFSHGITGHSLVLDFDSELEDPKRVVSKFLQVGNFIEAKSRNPSGIEETTKKIGTVTGFPW